MAEERDDIFGDFHDLNTEQEQEHEQEADMFDFSDFSEETEAIQKLPPISQSPGFRNSEGKCQIEVDEIINVNYLHKLKHVSVKSSILK